MKIIYIVATTNNNEYIDLYGAKVKNENSEIYETVDKIKIEGYKFIFPKEKINFEFEYGFVTDMFDKAKIRKQIDRVYKNLQQINANKDEKRVLKDSEEYYEFIIEKLNRMSLKKENSKKLYKI